MVIISPVKSKVYVKGFSCAKTECMEDYAQPTTREKADYVLIHVGTNDLPIRQQPDLIAENIQLALNERPTRVTCQY